jgi:phage gpG-like protein
MFDLTCRVNSEGLDRNLAAFHAALADFSPALRTIADDFREMVAEQFASEGRAGGTPWAELAPSTLRRRRRDGGGILYVTGALLRSLVEPGARGHIEEIDGESLVLGSALPYALFHQTGAGRGFGQPQLSSPTRRGDLPMRPLIVISGDRAEAWADIVRRRLEEELLLSTSELEETPPNKV